MEQKQPQQKNAAKVLNRKEVKNRAKLVIEAEIPLLGYYVYWSMSNFRITQTQFEEYLDKVGMDQEKYGKKSTAKVIVGQIVNEYVDKNRAKHKVKDEEDALIYNIHHKDVDAAKENVEYRRETRITLKKKGGTDETNLVVEGYNKEEIEKKYAEYLGTYTTEQFRNAMLSFCEKECQAVTMRDRGGIYFIPIQYEAELKRVKELFALVPGCEIDLTPIADMLEAKKTVYKAMTLEFKKEVRLFNEELNETKTVSEKVATNRVERYKALKAKAEMYGELLSSTVQDLGTDIDALTKRLKAKMTEEE